MPMTPFIGVRIRGSCWRGTRFALVPASAASLAARSPSAARWRAAQLGAELLVGLAQEDTMRSRACLKTSLAPRPDPTERSPEPIAFATRTLSRRKSRNRLNARLISPISSPRVSWASFTVRSPSAAAVATFAVSVSGPTRLRVTT